MGEESGRGSGRVGSEFLSAIAGRVGSGRVNVSPGRVGSGPRKVTREQLWSTDDGPQWGVQSQETKSGSPTGIAN